MGYFLPNPGSVSLTIACSTVDAFPRLKMAVLMIVSHPAWKKFPCFALQVQLLLMAQNHALVKVCHFIENARRIDPV